MLASYNGNDECVRVLTHASADLEQRYKDGMTALHVAAACRFDGCLVALLQAGAPVDATDSLGRTALMLAASSSDVVMVELLLQARADVAIHQPAGDGFTALMAACEIGDAPTVRTLVRATVQAGVSLDALNRIGRSALVIAVANNHTDLAVELLQAGATMPQHTGSRPRQCTCDSCDTRIEGSRWHCSVCPDFDLCVSCRDGMMGGTIPVPTPHMNDHAGVMHKHGS